MEVHWVFCVAHFPGQGLCVWSKFLVSGVGNLDGCLLLQLLLS